MKKHLFLVLFILIFAVPTKAAAATYTVAKSGGGTWNELNQINWTQVIPGDTILIRPGTYTTSMTVGKSGTATAPITIRATGPVVIFGGRSAPLAQCRTPNYTQPPAGSTRQQGIQLDGQGWINIDGSVWHGISIYGHDHFGIKLNPTSHDINIRNIEIYDNGYMWLNTAAGSYDPDQPGVKLGGTNITFDQIDLHDNGQDAFQSGGGINNITIRRSWMHNGRIHTNYPAGDIAWNYCRHSDGIQVYSGGTQSGVTIDQSIFGPGLLQGTILGQSGKGGTARIDNVTITNSLFLNGANANIFGYSQSASQNWRVDHVTSIMDNIPSSDNPNASLTDHAFFLEGAGHSVSNSIFYQGRDSITGSVSYSNNCQFGLIAGSFQGTVTNPQFTSLTSSRPMPIRNLEQGNYQPLNPICLGRGSSITSVAQFLALVGSTASPSPTPTPTPLITCNVADINKDGIVNGSDLSILVADFFKTQGFNPRSNINGDSIIDIGDYTLLVKNFQVQTGVCQ